MTNVNELQDNIISDIWNLYNKGLNRKTISENLHISEWEVRKTIEGNCRKRSESVKLYYKNNSVPLSYAQEQIILGSLLGDASLCRKDTKREKDQYYFQVGHCLKQKDYIIYKANILGSNVTSSIQTTKNSFSTGKEYFHTFYYNKYELKKIYQFCNNNGVKTVTKEWVQKLDPLAIAIWFMDDGSSCFVNNCVNVEFHTNSFSMVEQELLQNKLLYYNIESIIRKRKTGLSIYIKQKSVNILMDIIEPYIIDCMKYKIKRRRT